MRNVRLAVSGVATALLLGASVLAAPAGAQRASDCGQLVNQQDAAQTFTYTEQNRSNSGQVLAGLINAAIQNVRVPVTAANIGQLGANVSVVCVNDALNNNHLEILKDIDIDVIDDVTIGDITALNNVNILAIDLSRNVVYVAPR